jgi:hypothetical protein
LGGSWRLGKLLFGGFRAGDERLDSDVTLWERGLASGTVLELWDGVLCEEGRVVL